MKRPARPIAVRNIYSRAVTVGEYRRNKKLRLPGMGIRVFSHIRIPGRESDVLALLSGMDTVRLAIKWVGWQVVSNKKGYFNVLRSYNATPRARRRATGT